MGITIIYLQDQGENVNITAESIGSSGKAQDLANRIIQGVIFLDDVYYFDGQDISNAPVSPLIQ
jgi:hypothetical protein